VIHALLLVATMQRWLLVNDVHLDPFGDEPTLYHETDTSPKLWRSTVNAMRAELGDARVVIVGGDLLAHHWDSLARHAGADPTVAALETERGIVEDLSAAFPRAQFLFALGNNDDPCGDYRSETGGPYLKALASAFAPLVRRNGAAPAFETEFERGGYYEARLPNGERAIVLDSVFWSFIYGGACQSNATGAGASELAWFDARLSHLPRGKRAIVLMHIPPGYDGASTAMTGAVWPIPFLHASDNAALLATFARYRKRIGFALAAHTHHFGRRSPGGVSMIVGSSISPVNHVTPAFYELDIAADGSLARTIPFGYDAVSETWRRADLLEFAQRGLANECTREHLDGGYARCVGTQRRLVVAVLSMLLGLGAIAAAIALRLRRKRRA